MRALRFVPLLLGLLAGPALGQPLSARLDLPSSTAVVPGSSYTLDLQVSQLVGFDALQVFKFSVEYDPVQLEVVDLRPGSALAGWPSTDFLVDRTAGRVSVVAITAAPVALADQHFAEIDLQTSADLYDGERPPLRLRGVQPDEPMQFLATLDGAPIKIIAPDVELFVSGGTTCLAGDALGDGGFDSGDAIAILRIVTGLIADPDAALRCGADADTDGAVTVGDAVLTLRRAVGLAPPPARTAPRPVLRTEGGEDGLLVRIDRASAVCGVQLVARSANARFESVHTGPEGLVARKLDGDTARLALAGAEALAGPAGDIEIFLGTSGPGTVRLEEVVLFGADGAELFRADDGPGIAIGAAPRVDGPRLGNAPNPFNPRTTLWLELPAEGRAVVELFDMRGRYLARLLDESRPAGRSSLEFDGVVDHRSLPSGVYFARLRTAGGEVVHRMTLLK